MASEVPKEIIDFVASNTWTFAKTMPQWPHFYVVKDRCSDQVVFEQFVKFIREFGYKKKWGPYLHTYFDIGEYKYWTMGAPIPETTIINRALLKDEIITETSQNNEVDQELMRRYRLLFTYCSGRREQVTKFAEFLENNTSWLTSPASTRFHLNEETGLLRHSVGVAETLLKLRETLAPTISEESCVIAGLFHDLGKIGTFEKPNYIKNDNEWEVEKRNMKYKTNPDLVYMGTAARSLHLVSQHIKLTEQEAQAILYHDGQYLEANIEVAHHECLLTLLLQFADNWQMAKNEEKRE